MTPLDDAKAAARRLVEAHEEALLALEREEQPYAQTMERSIRTGRAMLAAFDGLLETCDDIASTNQGAHYNDLHWVKKQARAALAQVAALGEGEERAHGKA